MSGPLRESMRNEKSAEAVVAARRRAERAGASFTMAFEGARHQMSGNPELAVMREGEARALARQR